MDKKIELMPKERRRLYRIIRGIKLIFRDGEWHVRLMRIQNESEVSRLYGVAPMTVGLVSAYSDMIAVDYRFDLLATFVHECLHVLYPERDELYISELENWVMENISPLQAKRLLVLFLNFHK